MPRALPGRVSASAVQGMTNCEVAERTRCEGTVEKFFPFVREFDFFPFGRILVTCTKMVEEFTPAFLAEILKKIPEPI